MATRLDEAQVAAALADLDGWTGDRDAIARRLSLDEAQVSGLLADLEVLAREMNHDPDVDRDGGRLTLTMSTHSAGGVTELDIEYARRANELIAALA
jgi:4a-hydroxytetrahydrobiopterin dehydratase